MKFRKRNFVSITITVGFLSVAVTGLLYYFGIKNNAVEAIHVLFGILFVMLIVFHILYNFSSLKNYSVDRKTKSFKKELIWGIVFSGLLLIFMSFGGGVPNSLAEAGRSLVLKQRKRDNRHHEAGVFFSALSTNQEISGESFRLYVQFKEGIIAPQLAIWATDSVGESAVSLLYPSKTIIVSKAVNHLEDFQRPDIKKLVSFAPFNKTKLPAFNSVSLLQNPNYDSAGPVGSFILDPKIPITNGLNIFMEVTNGNTTKLYKASVSYDAIEKSFVIIPSQDDIVENIFVVKI